MNILRDWVIDGRLSLKMQAVLLASIRGCDGAPKDDASKALIWALRADILWPSNPKDNLYDPKGFMGYKPDLDDRVKELFSSLDQYPFHFIMHLTHAAEILGYYHPDQDKAFWWLSIYQAICRHHCHMHPETEEDIRKRLADLRP